MSTYIPGIILLVFLVSCTPSNSDPTEGQVDGYAPVYAFATDVTNISLEASRTTGSAGKIYAFGNFLLQNDLYQGIHIIDNSNRSQPTKTAFLKVPFSTEIAIKGKYLYTNNLNDLVVFDVSNMSRPQLIKRVENVFPLVEQTHPPFLSTQFECVDPAKGMVVRWERKRITNPKCRR
ncbi:MAG: hypothetical protein WKF97_20425 [Chitinophagaceae bacterium]